MARVVILGGTSDIGLAIAAELVRVANEPVDVTLAARPTSPHLVAAMERIEAAGAVSVDVTPFDALDFDAHPGVMDELFSRPVDVAIVAFGLLGEAEELWRDQAAAVAEAQVNTTAAISVGVLLGQAFTAQGSGQIIAVSSMAAEKVRRSNFVYGATKAGMDAFYVQLGEALRDHGVNVLVVRPGFVTSKMTAGRRAAAFATTAEAVGRETVKAMRAGRNLVRVPAIFGPMMAIYKHLPRAVLRRLSF